MPAVSIPPFLDLPPGVTSETLVTSRGQFAVLDNLAALPHSAAASRTAVMLPGFTGSKEDFIAILRPLGRSGVRAIALDLRGQYQTPGPAEADEYSLAGFAADVLALIDKLGEPVDVIGHSMGGLIAREVALANPLLLRSLVLMDSGPEALPEPQQQRLRQFAGLLAEHGLAVVWAAKQAMDEEQGLALPTEPRTGEFLTARFLANQPGSLLAMVDLLCAEPDRTDELAALAPQTLVLTGERDDVWSAEQQQAMAAALEARYVQLDGVGHSPAADAPDQTAAAILDFWGMN